METARTGSEGREKEKKNRHMKRVTTIERKRNETASVLRRWTRIAFVRVVATKKVPSHLNSLCKSTDSVCAAVERTVIRDGKNRRVDGRTVNGWYCGYRHAPTPSWPLVARVVRLFIHSFIRSFVVSFSFSFHLLLPYHPGAHPAVKV